MNEERKEHTYLIPARVTTRFELVPGVGLKDLLRIAIAAGIGLALLFITAAFFNLLVRLMILAFCPVTVFLLYRQENGVAIIDSLRKQFRFMTSKKEYKFKSGESI